jgi:hypothetical protein
MPAPPRGLHETLVTEALGSLLAEPGERVEIQRNALREAEAADRIAMHLARVVERAVASFGDKERVEIPEDPLEASRRLLVDMQRLDPLVTDESPRVLDAGENRSLILFSIRRPRHPAAEHHLHGGPHRPVTHAQRRPGESLPPACSGPHVPLA